MEMVGTDLETQQLKIKNEKLQEATRKHFSDIPLKEFMNRSKKLSESLRLKTAWSPYDKPDAYQNTFDYEKFEGNQVRMEDFEHDPDDNGEYDGKSLEEFIKKKTNAPEETIEAVTGGEEAEQNREDVLTERAERLLDFGQDPATIRWDKLYPGEVEDGSGDSEPWPLIVHPKLSPEAKDEIYKLHLQGWSVRDLSVRFGIMPRRVKAIIWMTQTFYDEYLPRMSIEDVRTLARVMPQFYRNTVDYGLDLQYMSEAKQGVPLKRFSLKPEDLFPTKEQAEKMEKLLQTQRRKKWDMVTEGFVGRGSKGYFVKSWHVYRGHGSERVNKKFKEVIQHSDRPYLLPKKVRQALEQGKGPRLAALGWGIK